MSTTKSEKETMELGASFASEALNGKVICLYGDLGSGKTVFTKGLAEQLAIPGFSIKSPTYTYVRKYKLKDDKKFYHIDLYRLDNIDELLIHELNEIFSDDNSIVIIEWANKIEQYLPKNRIDIKMSYVDPQTRQFEIYETK